jgi:hypothetical protein
MGLLATLQGLHALHTAGALTAEEFRVAKARALGTGGPATAAEPEPANCVKLEPPTRPAAAADRGARGSGQRVAARVGPEPTCVWSAKRRAVEVGVCAAAPAVGEFAAPALPYARRARGAASSTVPSPQSAHGDLLP